MAMASVRRGKLIATIVGAAVVAVYVVVTMAFVVPTGPVKTALAPVASAASPFFTQKWNVFAPNIQRSSPQLRIQAQWRDEAGELVKSEWVSMTELELASVPGNALPSRIQKTSWNALASYLSRYSKLNDEQRAIVRNTFIERHDGGFRAKRAQALIDELDALGSSRRAVRNLLRYDYVMKEYVTYFATAYFEHPIERVRWEIYRERPNDFDRRFEAARQHDPTVIRFGWRHADDVIREDALASYVDVVERYGSRH